MENNNPGKFPYCLTLLSNGFDRFRNRSEPIADLLAAPATDPKQTFPTTFKQTQRIALSAISTPRYLREPTRLAALNPDQNRRH